MCHYQSQFANYYHHYRQESSCRRFIYSTLLLIVVSENCLPMNWLFQLKVSTITWWYFAKQSCSTRVTLFYPIWIWRWKKKEQLPFLTVGTAQEAVMLAVKTDSCYFVMIFDRWQLLYDWQLCDLPKLVFGLLWDSNLMTFSASHSSLERRE